HAEAVSQVMEPDVSQLGPAQDLVELTVHVARFERSADDAGEDERAVEGAKAADLLALTMCVQRVASHLRERNGSQAALRLRFLGRAELAAHTLDGAASPHDAIAYVAPAQPQRLAATEAGREVDDKQSLQAMAGEGTQEGAGLVRLVRLRNLAP